MKTTVTWFGHRRSVSRLARLYEQGLSTHAIAAIESKRIGRTVKAHQVYNTLRSAGVQFRSLSVAMNHAPSLSTVKVRF